MMESLPTIAGISWLRADWLWGLVPLLLACLWWWRKRATASVWDSLVDPELQPYVIEGSVQARSRLPLLLFLGWALTLLMLAGPVWKQQEVPVFKAEQAEVLLFDLSRSMRADDIAPDRLTRARFKLIDLLKLSDGRQTGLIAFTERPYIISPLTEDAETIAAFIPSLAPEVMPVQGSRPDLAIERAVELLRQAAVGAGHVVLITDAAVVERDLAAARSLRSAGHRLSVLAVGTDAGAPLRDEQGQFVLMPDGAIVVPRINFTDLQALAQAGGGRAVRLEAGNADLESLSSIRQSIAIEAESIESVGQQVYWVEFAPWGAWALLPLMLFAFRRGIAS